MLVSLQTVFSAVYKGNFRLRIGKFFIDGEEAEPSYLKVYDL